MEDRLERVIGCLGGSGVGFGLPHAPRQHDAESPASRLAAPADGEDTVQQLQSRLEEMDWRLRREAAGDGPRGAVQTGAGRHAARARPEARHAGQWEQRLPQEAALADAWSPRRGQEALREDYGSRPAANTRNQAAKADAPDRGKGSGGHDARQHVKRRAREAVAGGGGHAADARASVEERDAMRWQARHRRSAFKICHAYGLNACTTVHLARMACHPVQNAVLAGAAPGLSRPKDLTDVCVRAAHAGRVQGAGASERPHGTRPAAV